MGTIFGKSAQAIILGIVNYSKINDINSIQHLEHIAMESMH